MNLSTRKTEQMATDAPMTTESMGPNKSFVSAFLNFVDQVGDRLGTNVPQIVHLESLNQLPEGTFGRSVANFYQHNGLQPFTAGPRRKQLHDCVHVLTGYGSDPIGELEVQAFLLGAKFHPFQLMLGAGLLRVAHHHKTPFPLMRPQVRQRLQVAYRRGQVAQIDIDAWQPETLWQRPLDQVQAKFHVEPTLKARTTLGCDVRAA